MFSVSRIGEHAFDGIQLRTSEHAR